MFCHKCGTEIADGAEFCHKCGEKVVQAVDVQQSTNIAAAICEPQQADAVEPTIAETFPQKAKGGKRRIGTIGNVLMWGSLILLMPFWHLPISPAVLVTLAAIGIILSAIGGKRPLGLSKIIELIAAVILLVIIAATTLSSSGGTSSDDYVQMVKSGTLNGYPQMTVGEAFDGFMGNPKWESGLSDNDIRFVNVTGKILYYDEEVELAVQFIVDEKNETFKYNACEINDVPQNNLAFWGILEAIYDDGSASADIESQGD